MQLRHEILKEHSRQQSEKIAKWVCSDHSRFNELISLLLHDNRDIEQRSAWILRIIAEKKPEWIIPRLKELLVFCMQDVHSAVKRNITAILQNISIPKELHGLTATICFDFLADPKIPVAIKVFSMSVLYNITLQERELRNELELLITEQLEISKPAFRSRGLKVLKQLNQLDA